MLTIIDYGAGNLRSVAMAFKRLNVPTHITADAQEVRRAQALVLPGVGAFGEGVERLRILGLADELVAAITGGTPFLGICLGLQFLFEVSDEMGEFRGLGVLPGRVRRFSNDLVVPHMGWNQVRQTKPSPLWQGVPDGSYAYFVHSYYVEVDDPAIVAGSTDYGIEFTSAVATNNLYAIQFHPEKSQDVGEAILRSFCRAAGVPVETP